MQNVVCSKSFNWLIYSIIIRLYFQKTHECASLQIIYFLVKFCFYINKSKTILNTSH